MIAKITRRVSAHDALGYDYGPGRRNEHNNPRRIAGTVAGRDWKARAGRMQSILTAADRRPGVRGRVVRISLSCSDRDRVMPDREWSEISSRFVDEYTRGHADNFAWEVVRHDPRHVHVSIMERGHDGKLLSDSRNYERAGRSLTGIERDHGLEQVSRERAQRRQRTHDVQRAREGKSPTQRALIQERLDAALAGGATLDTLPDYGITPRLNQARTGRVSGISFSLSDDPDALGFKGSELGRAYSWRALESQLTKERERDRAREREDEGWSW